MVFFIHIAIFLRVYLIKLFEYYIVKKGDNLYQIGLKYGLTAKEIAELNGLELNEYIYPDQKILVPKENVKIYITEEGDTLNQVAQKLNISKETIDSYNKEIYLLPEQLIAYVK